MASTTDAAERGSGRQHDPADTSLAGTSVTFGLWALLAYLTLGIGLEGMHGFKVGWYLEIETRRTLWTLGHAHGVLLALLCIGFGMMLRLRDDAATGWPRIVCACLIVATILLPGGFLLGGIYVYDGDPGLGVLLSPVGGVFLLAAVGLTALKYSPRSERGGD